MKQRVPRVAGFTLISALFLLVVVSGLAAYLVNISVAQHTSTALTLKATRGRQAALTGLEWVAYRVANVSNDCPPVGSALVVEGFTVTVTACGATDVTEGGATFRLLDVTVTAESGSFGDVDYSRLALRATLRG